MSYTAFRKAQFSKEAVKGTKPVITKLAVGKVSFNPEVRWFEPDEDYGRLSRYNRRIKVDESTKLQWEGGLTFEQCMYLFNTSIKGGVAGVLLTPGYAWSYDPNIITANAPDTLSLEVGDDQEQFDIPYVFCTGLELSFGMNDVWKFRADMVGRPMVVGNFTGSINPTTVEEVLGSKSRLYCDTTWAGLGGTEMASSIISGSIKLNTGFTPVKYGDANLYYTTYSESKRFLEADLVIAFNSDAVTRFAEFIAGTAKFYKIKTLGTLISGSTYKELSISLSGAIQSWDKLGERDGEDVVSIKLVSQYDQTGGKEFLVYLVNNVTAL